MAYIVAWSVTEKVKIKKNALFILPPIQYDIYEIKKSKRDAIGKYKKLVKLGIFPVIWGRVEEITIQK